MSAAYRVAAGTQVHLDGTTYEGGAKLPDLEPDTAARWLADGWITKTAEPTKTSRARKAAK